MKLVTRQQAGLKPATCRTALPASRVIGIAVHYSAAATDEFGRPEDRWRAIQTYHMSPGGHDPTKPWCDIAYNFGFRDDKVLIGRGWDNRSAAQGTNDGNDRYIAICYLGTDKTGRKDISPLEIATLSEFVQTAEAHFRKKLQVKPHSFFHGTECCGDELRAVISAEPWRHLKPRDVEAKPKAFWVWLKWRLGREEFKEYGPANDTIRRTLHSYGVPDKIPDLWWEWAEDWLTAQQ